MGSGHLLVYAFDVLMQIYESSGYGQRDAARCILEKNIYGLDIDDRAFQMAYFAIMMKARQYNRRILNCEYKPNVYSIQESNGINRNQLQYFGAGLNELEKNNAITQMTGLLDTFRDAKEYGSILTVDTYDWDLLDRFVSNVEVIGQMSMQTVGLDDTAEELKRIILQGKALAQKYHVTITNPPYMVISNSSYKLNEYVKNRYPDSKADLYSVFIEQCRNMTCNYGMQAMITMHSWMFISTFAALRAKISNIDIINMVHLGARAFEEIAGEVVQTTSFVFRKSHIKKYSGTYFRLVNKNTSIEKEKAFLNKEHVFITDQSRFSEIPSNPIAYWVNDRLLSAFNNEPLSKTVECKSGIMTGSDRYIKLWFEPLIYNIKFDCTSADDMAEYRWFPLNSGGEFRKWYGNNSKIVNLWHGGQDIINSIKNYRLRDPKYYFKKGITWGRITTSQIAFRDVVDGSLFGDAGPVGFVNTNRYYILGFLCSKVVSSLLQITNPTLNFQVHDIMDLPLIVAKESVEKVENIVSQNIECSKIDWDSFETSWDFKRHPLVKNCIGNNPWNAESVTIKECFRQWCDECNIRFNQLKSNEERLNRFFIDIYGLKDEISPEVEDRDVTVHRADLQREIISLLSYAVGCMFGRYSLSISGLACAGGDLDEQKYDQFRPDTDNTIPISDEEYLEDDIVSRLCTFLKVAFGKETLEENLDYIAKALGKKGDSSREIIRNYFLNDFFKDHCQTYSVTGSGKRPIYWLFDSGKQNGFKALIYLHRYNADTIGNLRIDYLHRMQRVYESEISRMQDMIDHSTNAREVGQATKRRDKLTKQLKECREYDEKLAHLALSRIELDLDDGVKVNYRKLQTANDGKFYEVLADSKNIMAKK